MLWTSRLCKPSCTNPTSSEQEGLQYLKEDITDIILAIGETRVKTCLARLESLTEIDPEIMTDESRLDWFPISLNEHFDGADDGKNSDDDSIRIVNLSELTHMLRTSLTSNFRLQTSNNGAFFFIFVGHPL